MIYYFFKTIISAILIVVISEISRRSSFIGAVLASVPLTSVLAILWLYNDTKDINQISELSMSIFWLVIPSLSFFVIFPVLLKNKYNFYLSMFISLTIMVLFYLLMVFILKKVGIKV